MLSFHCTLCNVSNVMTPFLAYNVAAVDEVKSAALDDVKSDEE